MDGARQGELLRESEWSQREAVRHRRSEVKATGRELGSSSQSIEPAGPEFVFDLPRLVFWRL
jgi:hypothetical protein